jgi:hypothetical protein
MAITLVPYNKFVQNGKQAFEWNDTGIDIYLALCDSSYTPNKDTHEFFDDITDEIVGGGYVAGGFEITGRIEALDTASDYVYWDADNLLTAELTNTFRYGIIYVDTGTPSTSRLIAYIDFEFDQSPVDAAYRLEWASPAAGAILRWQN